jgi:hypothetical protein
MANVDNPNGFKPWISPGASGQAKVTYLDLSASNSEIGIGSPLTIASGIVDLAAATNALCGISAEYKAASAGGLIAVWADPNQLFVAQTDDGTGTITAVAGVGLNASFVGTGVTGLESDAEIDEDSGATTATLELKIIRLSTEYTGDNGALNAYGEFNRMVVKINNHQFGSHTGTAGS